MTRSVYGKLTVSTDPNLEVILVLTQELFTDSLARQERVNDFNALTGSVLERLFELAEFNILGDFVDADGVHKYEVEFENAWNDENEKVIDYLAKIGVGIEGSLRGDDCGWGYRIPMWSLREPSHDKNDIVPIRHNWLKEITDDHVALTRIKALILGTDAPEKTRALSAEDTIKRVRQLMGSR
jgi:hypothetical protein